MSSTRRHSRWLGSRPVVIVGRFARSGGVGLVLMALVSLFFVGGAQAATVVNLGSASGFSVLGGSAISNVPNSTMSKDLGLYPGTSVTGAPQTLGTSYVNDGVAQQAQSDLATAITAAAAQPGITVSGGVLGGQPSFTPGVYTSPTLDLGANTSVTLDARGDPNAVFIFKAGSTLTTGSNTHVLFINGAQPCNVFWEIGSSATLGSNSTFVGTVMASDSITANAGTSIAGRLLANTGALSLDMNTITTSACAAGTTGGPTTTTTTTPTSTTPTPTTTTPTSTTPISTTTTPTSTTPISTTPTPTPTTGTTGTTPTTPAAGTTGTSKPGSAATKAAKAQAARAKAARAKAAKAKAARAKAAKARARARRLGRARAHRRHYPAGRPTATGGFTG